MSSFSRKTFDFCKPLANVTPHGDMLLLETSLAWGSPYPNSSSGSVSPCWGRTGARRSENPQDLSPTWAKPRPPRPSAPGWASPEPSPLRFGVLAAIG